MFKKTDKEKLQEMHDGLIDQLVAIDNLVLSLNKCTLPKEHRLPVIRTAKKVRNTVAKLKEAISQIPD